MYKVVTVLGTRPEIIKMSCLIPKLDKFFDHKLIFTGQNYDYNLSKIFFGDLNIRKPDIFLRVKSNSVISSISKIIEQTGNYLQKIKPDAFLIYGDTNSCLSAIAAKKCKIPIFHMEAGNRCFDDRVPEEINRRIIDHISDINIVLSEHARRNLIHEGIPRDRIFKSGSHLYEVLNKNINKIEKSNILEKLKLTPKKYFIISLHREENVDDRQKLKKLVSLISEIRTKNKNCEMVFSTHPRTLKRLKSLKIVQKNIKFLKPFSFTDYCKLQKNSKCCISDSGTIFEEASILQFPAITLRDAHERQEGIDSGSVLLSNYKVKNLHNHIKIAIKNFNNQISTEDYSKADVSSKIVKIVQGYIPFIYEKVWNK